MSSPFPPVSSCAILPDKSQEFDIPFSYQCNIKHTPITTNQIFHQAGFVPSVMSVVRKRFLFSLLLSETDLEYKTYQRDRLTIRNGLNNGEVNRIVPFS